MLHACEILFLEYVRARFLAHPNKVKRCGCFAEKAAGDDGAVAPRPHAAFAQADVPRAFGVAGVTREERRGGRGSHGFATRTKMVCNSVFEIMNCSSLMNKCYRTRWSSAFLCT